jgi:protein TonB
MKRSFLLSGALHALVLAGLLLWRAGWIETPHVPDAITVALIELVGSPAPAAPAAVSRPVERRPRIIQAARVERAAPARPARPVAVIAAPTLRAPAPAVTAPAARASEGEESTPGADVSGAAGVEAPAGPDDDRRMAIIRSRIQDALVYPREARRRGIEGTAQVRFDLREDGRLRSVELAASSGRDLLDDASVETVRRAQPFPYVEGALQVPVVFRLTGND